jgi:hypothetical protein
MPLITAYRKYVDDFFAAIAPFEVAFHHVNFSYIAIKKGAQFEIVCGRVFLNTAPPTGLPQPFASSNIRAGHYKLSDLGGDVRNLMAQLIEGKVPTPNGPLHLPTPPGGMSAASFVPFHPEGLQKQHRVNVLTLMGGQLEPIPQPDIDWEIKAGTPPYDSLQELAQVFGLGGITAPTAVVEFIAYNVCAIDGAKSIISGTNADIHALAARGLSHDLVTLGYRIYLPGKPAERGTIPGAAMKWMEEEQFDRGRVDVPVPAAAVMNCTISCSGIAQSHFWLSDPEQVQNPRRAAYETFDPKLENLKSIIANAQTRGQDAREFETAVAWLLWMLGFSVAHLGTGRRSRDAPDQVIVAPSGNFAVIECTTGLLKAENKLALLYDRAEAVRRKLAVSNNAHLRVLPVIVTSKTLGEITPDIEAAEKLGAAVLTREGLDQMLDRTLLQPDADQVYSQAEQAVSAALAKYPIQSSSPA